MKKQCSTLLLLTALATTGFTPPATAQIYDHKPRGTLAYFRAFPLADRGYGLIRQHRYAEALPLFERAVTIMPDNLEYRVQLVNLLIRTENYTRAQEMIDVGLRQYANNLNLLVLERVVQSKLNPPATDEEMLALHDALRQSGNIGASEKALITDVLLPDNMPAPVDDTPAPASVVENIVQKIAAVTTAKDPCSTLGTTDNLTPRENLEAGYCALSQNKLKTAEKHFVAATKGPAQTRLQAHKQLGYLHSANGNEKAAGQSWQYVLGVEDDASIRLLLTRSQRLQNQLDAAEQSFAAIKLSALEATHHAAYYNEAAALNDARGKVSEAIDNGARALALNESASAHYQQALRLQKNGQFAEAVPHLQRAHTLEPNNRLYTISLAYAHQGLGQTAEAVPLFRTALSAEKSPSAQEDFAYVLKAEGLRREAAQNFRDALPHIEDPHKAYDIKREIQQLEDRWQTVGSLYYSEGIARRSDPSLPANDEHGNSLQLGIEAVYSPDSWQKHGRRVQLYGQMFASSYSNTDTNRIKPNGAYNQSVFGIRATPLANVDWYVYFAKMVALGDNALNDWQLRTTYGFTQGFDYNPNDNHWHYLFLAPDVSWLTNEKQFVASVEGRAGESFRHQNWVFTPHVVAAAAHQRNKKDKNNKTSNDAVEWGFGISTKYWFAQTDARAPRGSADLILQWREPIGGSENKGGPFIRLVVQY